MLQLIAKIAIVVLNQPESVRVADYCLYVVNTALSFGMAEIIL